VSISDSEVGLSIEGNVAPDLHDVSFGAIEGEKDIYLNGGDVVLPIDFEWHLKAPTHVVAADTAYQDVEDFSLGTAHRIDLVLQGNLFTDSGNPSADSVWFAPEVKTASTADNWGGVFLGTHATHDIRYADFSYAANPLFVDWAGWDDSTATIRNSSIHHFADIGLWVHGTYGDGEAVLVDGCSVSRGSGLPNTLGRVGVFLDAAEAVTLSGSDVSQYSLNPPVISSSAVEAYFPKSMCDTLPPFFNCTLAIAGNTLVGSGILGTQNSRGVLANYLCGGNGRAIDITDNWIRDFSQAGLDLVSSSDIQVECNRVEASELAVDFLRESGTSGPGVRFRSNYLASDAGRTAVLRTDNAFKTKLGRTGTSTTKGDNVLWTSDELTTLTPFIREDEPGNTNQLVAAKNYWFKVDTLLTSPSVIDVPDLITTTLPDSLAPDSTNVNAPYVDVTTPYQTPPGSECWPPQGRVAGAPPPAVPAAPSLEASGLSEQELPTVTTVDLPVPNPTRGSCTVRLNVSREGEGWYRVAVFDVLGRRVATLADGELQAGRYRVAWNGRAQDGNHVVPGIYFVKVDGAGAHRNSKLVVVR
jgi:FlgD Ig-like domain